MSLKSEYTHCCPRIRAHLVVIHTFTFAGVKVELDYIVPKDLRRVGGPSIVELDSVELYPFDTLLEPDIFCGGCPSYPHLVSDASLSLMSVV